nr:MAG TPA: hypothetical protein [Caudoviricetes sp.]
MSLLYTLHRNCQPPKVFFLLCKVFSYLHK